VSLTADKFFLKSVYVLTAPQETIAPSIVKADLPVNTATGITTHPFVICLRRNLSTSQRLREQSP